MLNKSKKTLSSEIPSDDKARRAVQSIEVGGKLLLALADSDSALNLKDLAAHAGLTPSRAHPYLVSYGKLGLIEQDASGRYDLGPSALHIGLTCLRRLEPMTAAEPVIRNLANETGHAVAVAVWGNFGPTVVRLIEAKEPLHIALRIGSVLSIFDTATGRAFASALPHNLIKQAIAGPLGSALTPEQWKQRLPELNNIVDETKKHGISRAVGSPIPGVNAFSAAVYDLEGNPALVITMTDHEDRLPSSWNTKAASLLSKAARDLTNRLGGKFLSPN